MGKLIIAGGSGGSVDSSELTTASKHVLKGLTYIGNDTDGEIGTGTMPNNCTTTSNGNVPGISATYPNVPTREGTALQLTTDTNGTKRINLSPPEGYYSGGDTAYINRPASDFGNATTGQVLKDKTFTSENGVKVSGTIPLKAAATYYATTDDQTISSGQYLSGAQKINKLSATNFNAGNIKTGTTISVSNGNTNVYSVTGTFCGDATLDSAANLLSGNVAYGKSGTKYTGTMATLAGGTYTPSTSAQTISCNGKKMTSNIVINAIPSTYANISSGATVFNNGSFSYGYGWGPILKSSTSSSSCSNTGNSASASTSYFFSANNFNCLNRSMDLTKIKTITFTWKCTYSHWDNDRSSGNTQSWGAEIGLVPASNKSAMNKVSGKPNSSTKIGAGDIRTITADVSAYTGYYFIAFYVFGSGVLKDHPELNGTITNIKISA